MVDDVKGPFGLAGENDNGSNASDVIKDVLLKLQQIEGVAIKSAATPTDHGQKIVTRFYEIQGFQGVNLLPVTSEISFNLKERPSEIDLTIRKYDGIDKGYSGFIYGEEISAAAKVIDLKQPDALNADQIVELITGFVNDERRKVISLDAHRAQDGPSGADEPG